MKHGILCGEHELMVDEKNRLLIPAEVRRSLNPERDGEAFFLVIGLNRKPWLYPEKYYEHLIAQRQQDLMPDEDALAFAQYHFAMASRLEWDGQWRLLMPQKVMARTNTGKEITLIGTGDHMEIWNRSDWEGRFDELLRDSKEIIARAKRTQPPPA